jgi:lipopolysaccharide/colanic/teichoic acid biosynthesis glycosyltransferase
MLISNNPESLSMGVLSPFVAWKIYMPKRIFDVVLAVILALPAIFFVLMAFLLIYLETRGSPIFRQARVGQNKAIFHIIKLRTMKPTTPNLPSHQVGAAQITKTGRFLRLVKIDELPQIWNVLEGSMSFVGPRPCLPSQTELIEARDSYGIHGLKPGISGLSQVNGLDMSQPAKLAAMDAQYIGHWDIWQDLRILWCTVSGAGFGDAIGRR